MSADAATAVFNLEALLAAQSLFAEVVVESLRDLRAEVATLHGELAEMRDEALALAARTAQPPVGAAQAPRVWSVKA